MKETIKLSKKLKEATNGREYVANLEEVVKDLFSTPFKKGIKIRHDDLEWHVSYYEFIYGKKEKKDKSGVPYEKDFGKKGVSLQTLGQLRKHLKKSLKSENPDFKIQYQDLKPTGSWFGPLFMKVGYDGIHKIKKIILNEKNSSTYIRTRFFDKGLVEIEFEYNPRSYQKELERINLGVSKLQEKGYAIQ